ncbi:type I-E CRISPR-associated protein Cas6/Cse3/CasE [Pengzhenrongella sp.]|jgi:hypothetical protein|uniref:type I-E CRISPR-associated protein Cas6/Cse3/CasE n=1 Tax=Pengzhenrongella sp. TaxID=2888820 RepID=UPI002F955236
MTYQTLLEFPLTPSFAQNELVSLQKLHQFVMAAAGQLPNQSQTPRADLGVTFRLSLPGDDGVDGNTVQLLVRSNEPISGSSTTVTTPETGDRVRARVAMVAEKRLSRGTGNGGPQQTRPLTDDEAVKVAWRRLTDAGLQVDRADLQVSDARPAGARGTINVTYREIVAQAVVTDHPALGSALDRGIGRGKNYGFGLLTVET